MQISTRATRYRVFVFDNNIHDDDEEMDSFLFAKEE